MLEATPLCLPRHLEPIIIENDLPPYWMCYNCKAGFLHPLDHVVEESDPYFGTFGIKWKEVLKLKEKIGFIEYLQHLEDMARGKPL